jgi:glycine cleavage system H protein
MDMELPEGLRYSEEHEWLRREENAAVIGITEFAQDQLGDVVYVELPREGDVLEAGQPFGVVESVKAASDLYAPVSGTVVAVNDSLEDEPERVNSSPYADGWMIRLEPVSDADVAALMDAQGYSDFLAKQED